MDYSFRRNVLDTTLSAQLKLAKSVLQSHKKTVVKFLEIEMGLQVENLPDVLFQTQEDKLYHILESDFPDFDFNEYFSIYDVGLEKTAMLTTPKRSMLTSYFHLTKIAI